MPQRMLTRQIRTKSAKNIPNNNKTSVERHPMVNYSDKIVDKHKVYVKSYSIMRLPPCFYNFPPNSASPAEPIPPPLEPPASASGADVEPSPPAADVTDGGGATLAVTGRGFFFERGR